MPILDHFGLIAPYYDRVISLKQADQLKRLLGIPGPQRLLDAGGGTGRVAQALQPDIPLVVIADLSRGMLRQAQGKDGLQVVNSHTEALPFPDASFERIVMVDALHHVCDQPATAAEMWRVLAPGGRIVIEEPDIRTTAVKLIALAEKLLLMRSHFLAPGRIASLFDLHGASHELIKDGYNVWVVIDKR